MRLFANICLLCISVAISTTAYSREYNTDSLSAAELMSVFKEWTSGNDYSSLIRFGEEQVPQINRQDRISLLLSCGYVAQAYIIADNFTKAYQYIGLFKGRLARYDMESEESQIVRFMLDDRTPLEYTTFHIHNGYILLGGEFSQDNITNPPVYKIPLNVFLQHKTSQK